MDKMFITNQMGERLEVGVVRFFEYNNTAFLIYTLSETDANNYVKLYVTKINIENVQSVTITEEAEWNLFKDVMKEIIRNNKGNLPLQITDLNPQVINNVVIYDAKVFKLNSEMVNFLQMNKKVVNNVTEVENASQEPAQNIFNIEQSVAESVQEVVSAPVANETISVPETNVNEVEDDGIGVSIPEIPTGLVFSAPIDDVQSQEPNVQPIALEPVAMPETNDNENNGIGVSIPEITPIVPKMPVMSEVAQENIVVAPIAEEAMDYQKAYQEENAEVNELIQKVANLENEINNLNAKLEQIKNIIG